MRPSSIAPLLLPLILAALGGTSPRASAAPPEPRALTAFGARASTVVAIDDLAGIYRQSLSVVDAPSSNDSAVLGFGTTTGAFGFNETTRLGVHRFVTPEISVGSGLHFSTHGAGVLVAGERTVYGISPRVGFAIAVSETSAFWLRAGFQYHHSSYGSQLSGYDFGPGVEVFYVWTPHEHFGVTVGPMLEVGLAGHIRNSVVTGGPTVGDAPAQPSEVETRRNTVGFAVGFLFDF